MLFHSKRLFEHTVLRELSFSGAAFFFVLIGVMIVTRGVRLLELAASGYVATQAVLVILGFLVLSAMPWLITVAVYGAVLFTLGRGWRDHEMVIWQTAGLSLSAWIRPVLFFALPLAVLAALLSLGLTPWAKQKGNDYREQIATQEDLTAIAPGLFKESASSDRVYFLENFGGEHGAAQNLFVQSQEHDLTTVTVASEGYLLTHPDGERILVLRHGRRYENTPGKPDYRVLTFDESRIRITEPVQPSADHSVAAKSAAELLNEPGAHAWGEIHWRLATPLATLLLALLAIPLSYFNPRRGGRAFGLVVALLLFSIYLNLANIGSNWIADEKISPWLGLWPLHSAVALTALLLFRWRNRPA